MPTSLEYLHALAAETGEYGAFTTTSSGSTTSLVCLPLANSGLAASEFAGMYVLVESGAAQGETAMVRSLTRSSGTLITSDAFTATIASGVSFSLYELAAPIGGDNVLPSYLQMVNWALRRIQIDRTISFSGVTGQHRYTVSQATYPWWTSGERIRWIEYPATSADEQPRRLAAADWDWEANGATQTLYFRSAPFRTGETFSVRVRAPANSLLKKNGTWTEQTSQTAAMALFTSGVADEALPDVDTVVAVGTARLYRALSRVRQPSAVVAEWLAKAEPAAAAAARALHDDLPADRVSRVPSLRYVRVGRR